MTYLYLHARELSLPQLLICHTTLSLFHLVHVLYTWAVRIGLAMFFLKYLSWNFFRSVMAHFSESISNYPIRYGTYRRVPLAFSLVSCLYAHPTLIMAGSALYALAVYQELDINPRKFGYKELPLVN